MINVSSKIEEQVPAYHYQRTKNNIYPLEIDKMGSINIALKLEDTSKLWHERYGHLNNKALKLLKL